MTDVRTELSELDLRPNKALGQNFLTDEAAIERIVSLASEPGLPMIEIGPGLGALTEPLSKLSLPLAAVELDSRLASLLSEKLGSVRIINEDFLKTDLNKLRASLGGDAVTIVGNLPYYVTTPILKKLVLSGLPIRRMVLMMQSEAAERFLAGPGDKSYVPITLESRFLFDITPVFELSPSSYYPMPDVRSTVLLFEGRGLTLPDGLHRLLTCAFAMRRKTLVNNLSSLGIGKPEAEAILKEAGISPGARAEELDLPDFLKLDSVISSRL